LLGSYLAEKYNGDIAHLADIPIPTANEPRYERVHRVLRRYDEHLTEGEREFLKLFSAFRTPVHESAFEKVFVPLLNKTAQTDSQFTNFPITNLVNRLVTYRILHCDTTSQTYTAHPLVRNHYLAILTHGDSTEQHDVHGKIKDYYLSIAGDTPQFPTLDDLKPLIEVVHHACQAGAYDEAHKIVLQRIYQGAQGERYVITQLLGAYDTALSLLLEFFPNGDPAQQPFIDKYYYLSAVGTSLKNLGRPRDAVSLYERSAKGYLSDKKWRFSGRIYQNLADLHESFGALDESIKAARKALNLARRAENKGDEDFSLAWQGWLAYLQNDLPMATSAFSQAEVLEKDHGYYGWMMNSDFPLYTKKVLTMIKLAMTQKIKGGF